MFTAFGTQGSWRSATPFVRPGCPQARSTPANTIAPTKLPSLLVSRTLKTTDLTEGGLIVSPNENDRRAEAFRKMIATPPQPHTVTILITHQPNIIAALGRDWFDVKEGEASIFRPSDGSYKLVARVQMDQRPCIAAAK
jgi:hypothetical protein